MDPSDRATSCERVNEGWKFLLEEKSRDTVTHDRWRRSISSFDQGIYFSAAILALFSSSACFISDRWNRRKLGTAINRRSEGFLRKPISRESRLDRERETKIVGSVSSNSSISLLFENGIIIYSI